jgi:ATP-dependent Clp protease protease subunit
LNFFIREAEEYCIVTSLRLRIDELPIYLHIYSNGGYIHAAFAAIDVIKSCKVPVYSIIEGATASAGTLISVVCKKRFIRPTSYMLIHQLSSECWGKMSEITDEYKNLTNVMDKITKIYKKYSKLSPKKLEKLLKHDLWLDAKKSIKYGLADELYI